MVDEQLRANVRRTALVLMAGFLIVALALGYWQVVRAGELALAAENPRVADARLSTPRGRILDRTGAVLARSVETPEGMQRRYAEPSLVHTIGYFSARFGATNLEARFDEALRGVRTPDAWERLWHELLVPGTPATPADLVLTIDQRVQEAAVAALGDARGAIVALDPKTGAVLALVSQPFFDPNLSDDALAALLDAPDQPFFNRAVQATYVPGSTFKAVTATAAVDLGLVDLDEPFTCTEPVKVGEYVLDCENSQHASPLTYEEAFAWSSNRTFGLSGLLLGFPPPMNPWLSDTPPGPYPWTLPGVGIEESAAHLVRYAERFGFTRDIPFELPVTPSQVKTAGTAWTPALLAQTAFGQGQLEATPLQMALVAAAIANGGLVPNPYLVAEIRSPRGAATRPHRTDVPLSRAMSPTTAQVLTAFMVEGVEEGYGSRAQLPGVEVGGKTGTAEIGDGESHSWFIGFAPADEPQVAVAVIGERQGSGAQFATIAAQRVLRAALDARQRS